MPWTNILAHFTFLDQIALGVLVASWLGIGLIIENPPKSRPSVSRLMGFYRREWMRQFVDRGTRVFDAQIISNLRQSTAFFASTSMIAIGGLLALLGNTDRVAGIAKDLTQTAANVIVIEVKLTVIVIFLANAFLKFVWSHRLFGYCAILMASVPNSASDPAALPRAEKAAAINVTASRSFNRALRSVYFGMACLAWLFGAKALIGSALITLIVLGRREFASHSREALTKLPR